MEEWEKQAWAACTASSRLTAQSTLRRPLPQSTLKSEAYTAPRYIEVGSTYCVVMAKSSKYIEVGSMHYIVMINNSKYTVVGSVYCGCGLVVNSQLQ